MPFVDHLDLLPGLMFTNSKESVCWYLRLYVMFISTHEALVTFQPFAMNFDVLNVFNWQS